MQDYKGGFKAWAAEYLKRINSREPPIPDDDFLRKPENYKRYYNYLSKHGGFGPEGSSLGYTELMFEAMRYDEGFSIERDYAIISSLCSSPPVEPKPLSIGNVLPYVGLGLLAAAGIATAIVATVLGVAGVTALLTPPGLIAAAVAGLVVGAIAISTMVFRGVKQARGSRALPTEVVLAPEATKASKPKAKNEADVFTKAKGKESSANVNEAVILEGEGHASDEAEKGVGSSHYQ